MESIIMLVAVFAVFYFMVIRPENKRKKETEQMRKDLKKGDQITTIGGIMGKVVATTENSVVFETSEDRVRIEVAKWAIANNNTAEAAAAEEKKAKLEAKAQGKASAKAEEAKKDIEG